MGSITVFQTSPMPHIQWYELRPLGVTHPPPAFLPFCFYQEEAPVTKDCPHTGVGVTVLLALPTSRHPCVWSCRRVDWAVSIHVLAGSCRFLEVNQNRPVETLITPLGYSHTQ